jgi:putative ABC transport system permease protein
MNSFTLAWRIAWKNMRRNRRRSLVTILIAAMGAMSILVAGGFALGTYKMLGDYAAREYGHITISSRAALERDEEFPLQFGIEKTDPVFQKLAAEPRIRHILPRVAFSGLIANDDKSVIFMGVGARLAEEVEIRGMFLTMVAGSVAHVGPEGAPNVLVGVDLARSLGARPGSPLTLLATTTEGSINAIDVLVAGIITSGWEEVDKRLVFTDLEAAQRLLGSERLSSLSVYLDDLEEIDALRGTLAAFAPELAFRPWWEQAFYYQNVKELYNRIFGLLGGIITLLVVFSVSNTLAMSVVERTAEIGALRALGAYPGEIVAQFVREGLLIGAIGVLLGNLAAALVVLFLPSLGIEMPPPPGRSTGYPLLVIASVPMYVIVNSCLVVLCGLAAWIVSRKAARKPIMEALRHA